jgi:signal transduction histidine kinase/CheY-like chemotaxis protein
MTVSAPSNVVRDRSRIRRLRHAIVLVAAFVTVLSVTATAIALLSFDRLADSLALSAREDAPAVSAAVRLTSNAAMLAAAVPGLPEAAEDKTLETRAQRLHMLGVDVIRAVAALRSLAGEIDVGPVDEVLGELRGAIVELRSAVIGRNAAVERRKAAMERARRERSGPPVPGHLDSGERDETFARAVVECYAAELATVAALEAIGAADGAALAAQEGQYRRALGGLRDRVAELAPSPESADLTASAIRLGAFDDGTEGLAALRRTELSAVDAVADLTARTRLLSERLVQGAALLAARIESDALTGHRRLDRDVASARMELLALCLGAVLLAAIAAVLTGRAVRRRERALRGARDDAERLGHRRALFFAMMSHEIRTPINGVIGLADGLLEGPLDAEQHHNARTIAGTARTLLGIVNDILDFARIDGGYLKLRREPFELPETVERVIDLLAPLAAEKDLDLRYVVAPSLSVPVLGDAGRVRQVLVNLAGNAVKFTERGSVSISVEDAGVGRVRIVIEDTGSGVPADAMASLFTEFAAVEDGVERRVDSTGLGLAVSRRLVEAMEGVIGVVSTPGQGSRFWFELPLPRAGAVEPPPPEPAGRLLVVDASPSGRATLATQCAGWGWSVETAATGGEAVRILLDAERGGTPFDQVLIDRVGADTVGLELARAITGHPRLAEAGVTVVLGPGLSAGGPALFRVLRRPLRHSAVREVLSTPPGGREPPRLPLPPLRVLVAEDNTVSREVLVRRLRRGGHGVEAVADGRAAVEAVRARPFDLVLMDIRMPGLDGLAAAAAIRALGAPFDALPIIALTADASDEERERCRAAGMNDCLSKLLDQIELNAVIERWCGARVAAVDEAAVGDLVAALGAGEYARLADLFFTDAIRIIRHLELAETPDGIGRQLHNLKGAAQNLGLVSAADAIERVRRLNGDAGIVQALSWLAADLDHQRAVAENLASEGFGEKSAPGMKKGLAR